MKWKISWCRLSHVSETTAASEIDQMQRTAMWFHRCHWFALIGHGDFNKSPPIGQLENRRFWHPIAIATLVEPFDWPHAIYYSLLNKLLKWIRNKKINWRRFSKHLVAAISRIFIFIFSNIFCTKCTAFDEFNLEEKEMKNSTIYFH